MKITIEAEAKEIADLIVALQGQHISTPINGIEEELILHRQKAASEKERLHT